MNRYSTAAPATSITTPASTASLVARAADEFLEQLARGEAPDVDDFVRRYPQVAGVLPEVLPALQLLQALTPPEHVPDSLGDFRIVGELGRGGMGVVYEAEQVSLGRRVALKVLPAALVVDARQLARFRIEAQVAAALHHPHIVPIFAVGCDRGMHYYAMQLIEGRSLAERLRDPGPGIEARGDAAGPGPLSPREAARLAMQAAEALDHAHALGVVHRDIKPGNLLVDSRGHLWVTDFGLARSEGTGDLTRSGDLLGTLRYMSPEQSAGGRVLDERTDVYSLGVTLYELLTARPALDGDDRQELLRRIAHDEPTPLRRLDPSISGDLETIVGKAMAKEPERRYASARALAEDLGRFLEGRPILARRPGPMERMGRWSRRHKRATVAAAAALVLVSMASAGGMARLWEEQRRTRSALATVREARRRERQALIFTFTASDRVAARALVRIASPGPKQAPAEVRSDREFCRKALDYYREIADRYRDDPEMPAIVAAADHRIGFIRMILKEPGAESAYRRSIALFERLLAAAPGSRELPEALALAYYDLSLLLRTTGEPAAALDCFPPLLALRRGLGVAFPEDTSNPVSLAYLRVEYCNLLENAGRSAEAGEVRRQFREGSLPILRRVPDHPGVHNILAWQLAWRPGSTPQDAILAIELARQAVAIDPANGAWRNTLGVAYYRAGDPKAAVAALEASMALRSGGDPYDWLVFAMARWRLGDRAEARRQYDRSLDWMRSHATHDDELFRFRDEAARLLSAEESPARATARDVGLIK